MAPITALWRRLTDAPARITDPETRQKIRLLSGLLLVLIPLAFVAISVQALIYPGFWISFLAVSACLALLLVAYGVAHAGRERLGALITVVSSAVACLALVALNPSDAFNYSFLFVSMLLAALLFGQTGTLFMLGVNLAAVALLLPSWGVPYPSGDPLAVPMFLILIGALLLVSLRSRDTLERLRSREILASEARFRATFHDSPVAMTLSRRRDGCFLDANRVFEQWSGWSLAEIVGRTSTELNFWSVKAREQMLQAMQQRGAVRELQLEVRVRSGETRVILGSIAPVLVDGEDCLLATLSDVTAHQRAEQALRDSESRYRTIVETAQEGIWTIDADSRTSFVNRKMAEILGHTVEAMQGRPLFDFMDEEGKAIAAQNVERRKADVAEQHDFKFLRADGSVVWAELNTTPMHDEQGNYAGALAMVTDITERRHLEAMRVRLVERLDLATRAARIGIWDWDVVKNELFWDDRMFELYGTRRELLSGAYETWVAGLHPDDRERAQEAVARALRNEAPYDIEFRVRWPDGAVRFIKADGHVVRDDAGKALRMIGTNYDITEQRRAERALRDSEKLLQLSQSLAQIGSWQWNPASSEVAWSEVMYVIYGWPRTSEPVTFERAMAAIHPDDSERMGQEVRDMLAGQGAINFEYRIVRPDGNVRTVWARTEVQRAADGSPLRAVGTLQDITDRIQSEAQMRKLSSAIEQTADSVVITDPHGVIEYVNPAFERGTGFTSAEALGQTPRLVRSGKQGQSFYRNLWNTILAGEVYSDVLINRRKDGTFYYEEKTITPLKDATGQITHFISTGKDVTERMQTQEKLEFMAQHDALTELPNRALLLDRLKQSVARARWHRRMVAVLFVDLDRFKTINDTLGHEAGDQLLQQLGVRFSNNVREGDTVARFGGDEFVILLSDVASDKDIGVVAQKILDALKGPFEISNQSLHITASIGISLFPNDGEDSSTLLKHADIAMYRAKEMGKNTYQFYSADMSARAFERLSLENSLRQALGRNEFVLHYQPQFDVSTGRIFGVEALLRWQHPDFGLVAPGDFISLLEETGLIVPTGEWVLEEAGRQYRAWHESGYRNLRLAVNLSPRQVQSGALLATVQRVLANGPEESGWLELEITEGLLVQQSAGLMEFFETLRTLGVRLAIDDFGTGYSSLSYLRRLPIDTLKIDRSFVRDVPGDADDSAITTTIIAMAQSLRLEVIAEGVENEAQRDFLGAYGCRRMQGYLFARPMPAAELSRLLAGGGSGLAPG